MTWSETVSLACCEDSRTSAKLSEISMISSPRFLLLRFAVLGLVVATLMLVPSEVMAGIDRGAWHLVDDGNSRCTIVIGENATLPELHAAEELSRYLKKISGAAVPIVKDLPQDSVDYPIYIGTNLSHLAGNSDFSEEGFLLHSDDRGLVITGRSPVGALYGTYAFLEDVLGVRWLMPGEDGEFVPKATTISIPQIHKEEQPFFTTRTLDITCVNPSKLASQDTWDWMVRNRMQISVHSRALWDDPVAADWLNRRGAYPIEGGHALASFVPEGEFFDTHPEYFPLINGKRVRGAAGVGEGEVAQRCLSNPAVVELGVRHIDRIFSEKPDNTVFLVGANDGLGWCECDDCKALYNSEEKKHGSVTSYFFRYINAVADQALKKHPGRKISAWAYADYRMAPVVVEPDPRLELLICLHTRDFRHSLDDERSLTNAGIRKIIEDWSKFPNPKGFREYYACMVKDGVKNPSPNYVPLEDIVARDIKYAAQKGCKVWVDETPPVDGDFVAPFNGPSVTESWQARFPMYYVAAKLLWDPVRDIEEIKDDVARAWFGDAAEEMRAYRALLSKSWSEADGDFVYDSNSIFIGKALEFPGREKQLIDLLDAATAKAQGDTKVLGRIAIEKKYFQEVWVKMAQELHNTTAFNDVHARECKGPISVDGSLSEEEWALAPVTTGFHRTADQLAGEQTFVKILHDDDAVYFGLEMLEPMPGKLRSLSERNDDPVWEDDSIELFIDSEKSGQNYFHIAVNPKGLIYDSKSALGVVDAGFTGNYEVATRILNDRWIAEIKIPASELSAEITRGGSWKVNVGRSRTHSKEASSWTDGGFHHLTSFRSVVFGESPAIIRNGGFEEVVKIASEGDGTFYSVGTWDLGEERFFPLRWGLHHNQVGKLTFVQEGVHSGRYAAKVEKGTIFNTFPAVIGDKLTFTFWDRGEGKVRIMLFQNDADEDGVVRQFLDTVELETIALENEWTKYSIEHTIITPSTNTVSLALDVQEMLFLDDVTAVKSNNTDP